MSYVTRAKASKTNFSANGQLLALEVTQLNTCRIEFSGTYTFTGTFEVSNDSTNGTDGTWFPLQMAQTNTNVVALSHATANATQAYESNVNEATWVRVRLTAYTSAGAHQVLITATDAATEPNPVVQVAGTVPVSGTTTNTPVAPSAISVVTTASNNLSNQKATAGSLFELTISNPTATAAVVKLYNKATAPVVATDVPILAIPVAAAGNANGLDKVALEFGALGKRFTTGIAMAVTGLVADTDATNTVAGIKVHGSYV